MTEPDWSRNARLEVNARSHKFDARLDAIADLMDRGDVEAWQKLPVRLIGEASMYRDIRANYNTAVAAGVIRDDRGPHAA